MCLWPETKAGKGRNVGDLGRNKHGKVEVQAEKKGSVVCDLLITLVWPCNLPYRVIKFLSNSFSWVRDYSVHMCVCVCGCECSNTSQTTDQRAQVPR